MLSRRLLSARACPAILAVTLLLTLGLAAIVRSGDSRDRRIVPPDEPSMHPVATEIQHLADAQAARLRDLNARARETEDPDEELALQREIQRVKVETEIDIYEAQLRHAESRGDLETATTLRDVLATYEKLGKSSAGEGSDVPARDAAGEEVAP